jgi:hypothetical protein
VSSVWERRHQLIACATRVFHVSALTSLVAAPAVQSDIDERQQALQTLHLHFGPLVFRHSRGRCPYTSPPEELFVVPTNDDLWQQYRKLLELVRDVYRKYPEKAAVVEDLEGVLIEDGTGIVRQVPARAVNLASLRCVVSDGRTREFVTSRKYGEVEIIMRVRAQVDHKMHAMLMSMNYQVVSGLWHILRLYHRIMMWSSNSEAIAEHVGSLIRFVEKKHSSGGALDVLGLVRAARLRAAGLRGDTSDAPLIMRAMHLHFKKQAQGPHFFLGRPRGVAACTSMLGPSVTISKIRQKRVEADGQARPWLVHSSRINQHACKQVRRSAVKDRPSYLPDALPSFVWDAVGEYMDNFELGAEVVARG